MSVVDKVIDGKETLALNLKRAPSAGTVTSTAGDNMWERSQSDANLSIHKDKNSVEKVNVPNVSDNARVYWDLSHPEQGDVTKIPVMNTSAIGGFQMALETIHQHDEMFEGSSSKESVSSNSYYESNSSFHKLEGFSKNQTHGRNNSYTFNSGISSMEHLSNFLSNSYNQNILEQETRKSCSALPTAFRRRSGGIINRNELLETDIKHSTMTSTTLENIDGIRRGDMNSKKPPLPLEVLSSNYFCESDFDDSREQIPNYQSKLKSLQDEMMRLILLLEVNQTADFIWPNNNSIEKKTEILSKCSQMLRQAWLMPNFGRDCATSLCDLIRQQGFLSYLTLCMSHAGEVITTKDFTTIRKEVNVVECRRQFILMGAELFSQILICDNLDSILGLSSGNSTPKKDDSHEFSEYGVLSNPVKLFKEVVKQSWLVKTDKELNREFIAILEAMLKHHEKTNRLVVQSGGLKSLIYSCRSTDNLTLRHVAFALVNLGLFGDSDVQMTMAHYKVADWLFPLAFNNDDIIKYYACLAIVVLSAHKELTQIVHSSGTIELVFSFIKSHSPYHFAEVEPSHFQGRSSTWLQRLLPLLKSDSVEAVSLASFHFVMEARIKQRQGKIQIFKDIGAIDILRKCASSIHKIAAQFSRQTLKILGVTPPFSLSHPVPIWSVEDVTNWLRHIGFEELSLRFQALNIDGDILLTINESILKNDLDIKNGVIRLRLMRDLNKLKTITTYETCDPSGLCDWLKTKVGSEYCKYTYAFIKAGIDRKFLIDLTEDMLEKDCFITNSVHRTRILNAIEACKVKFQKDSSYSISSPTAVFSGKPPTILSRPLSMDKQYPLSCENCVISNHADDTMFSDEKVLKNIDVFISYRRSNGAQLASLIMVHLRLRGYRVFLDIERLPAGKFNENLLQSIQRAKNFLIVLTPNSLDRCANDTEKKDWIHREIVCAMENNCNIIPITDRFVFPMEDSLPADMKNIVNYNAVNWVHDYQDACVDKIEQFIKDSDCKCPFSPPQVRMSPILKQSIYSPNLIDDLLIC